MMQQLQKGLTEINSEILSCCNEQILNVPYRAHNDLLHFTLVHTRQLDFIVKCLKSSNSVVKLCASLLIGGSTSDDSCTINYICS